MGGIKLGLHLGGFPVMRDNSFGPKGRRELAVSKWDFGLAKKGYRSLPGEREEKKRAARQRSGEKRLRKSEQEIGSETKME